MDAEQCQNEVTSTRTGDNLDPRQPAISLLERIARLSTETKTMLFGCLMALGLHVLFFAQFWYFGVYPLAYFNVLSILTFVFCVWHLTFTNQTSLVISLASIEVTVHQGLAVTFLGWDCGYQFYLLTIPVFAHLGRFRNRKIPQSLSFLALALLAWLLLKGQYVMEPHYFIPPKVASVIYVINLFSTGFLLAQFASIFSFNVALHERALQQSSEAKSRFLATVSHEFRTPMNAIVGFTELALDKPSLDGDVKRDLLRIQSASRSLLNLINDILDFSKIEAGKLDIVKEDFRLRVLIDELEEMFIPILAKKPVSFEVRWNCREDIDWICGDSGRIRQILLNLIGNAVKFTEAGVVALAVEVHSGNLAMSVEDTGPGIEGAILERLFEPFLQADSRVQRSHGGTGLGLSISRRLAYLMGGELQVKSVLGKGSRFTFVLPLQETAPETVAQRLAEEAARETGALPKRLLLGMRLLVVDDVELNRDLAREILEKYGAQVTVAASGAEAVQLIGTEPAFEAVFMDVSMPEMSGYEATRLLREKGFEDLPIIAMTAHARTEDREKAIESGMNGHLSKPIDIKEIAEALSLHPSLGKVESTPAQAVAHQDWGDHLDYAQLVRRLEGDQQLLNRLLLSFVRRYHDVGERLDSLLRSKDLDQLQLLGHELKGAAANVSACRLQSLAAQLEVDGSDGEMANVLREISEECRWLKHRVEPVSEAEQVAPSAHENGRADSRAEALREKLAEALLQNDMEALTLASEAKDELGALLGTDTFTRFYDLVTELDFESAAKLLHSSSTSEA